ncbi:MAG: NUDIX hydrolase [Gammaproteobacteria bacterium]
MPRPQTPLLAADVVIELAGTARPSVVLVRRANPPLGWALPGGFVDIGETVETAARREALEETGLEVFDLELLGVYSDPGRDPRGHTVSAVFICRAEGEPCGGDDAAEAAACPLEALPPLVFDHARILADYQARRSLREDPDR